MARVNVRVNLRGLQTQINRGSERARFALANQVLSDSNQYAPFKSGDLRSQSRVSTDGRTVQWNAPYARRLYYEQFVNYSTPNTGPRWVEKAKSIHLRSWERVARVALTL